MALWAFLGSWWLATAHAADVALTWSLTVDGAPAGQHTLSLRDVGDSVQVLESYVELTEIGRAPPPPGAARFLPWNWPVFRKRQPVPIYQHRVTATEANDLAFHSVFQADQGPIEVQGRPIGGVWRLMVTQGGTTRPVAAPDVAHTTMALLDPDGSWRTGGESAGRMLDVRTGQLTRGSLVRVGPATLTLKEGTAAAEHWEWRGDGKTWRLFYGRGGALLRYETELAGRAVQADLVGGAPLLSDEFDVPLMPAIETIEVSSD